MDPAKPLIQKHGSKSFRLTRDDATHVQIVLTNAGFLGQSALSGTVNFCINGGRDQPYCSGNQISELMALRARQIDRSPELTQSMSL